MNTGVETPIKVTIFRAQASQADANIPKKYTNITFPLVHKHTLQMQGLELITLNGETKLRIKHLVGKLPKWQICTPSKQPLQR